MKKFTGRIIAAVTMMAVIMTTLLAGCGSSANTAPAQNTGAEGGNAAPDEGGAEASSGGAALNIAIATSLTGVDDGSFNQNNYDGIQAFVAKNPGSKVTAVKEESGDVTACITTVSDIVADYDVIVLCGFQFAGIGDIAKDNPDVKFIMVDTDPTDSTGNTVELDNVYAMTFKEQESGFCAGIAAALETKTGKVASVHGIAYPSNVNYQWGFESGVNYANAKLGANAEVVQLPSYAGTDVTGANVGGNYAGSFADEATGKVIGDTLYDQGVDIIFVSAGGTGNGVFTAAKERSGVYVIGCDVDQYDDGVNNGSNIVLTSVLKIMGMNVEKQLNAIKDGSFKGGNYLLGADTDSTGYVSESSRCQLSDATIASLDEAFALVKSGEVVPAYSFGDTTPENFQGLK